MMEGEHVTRLQLAREFNRRYGNNIFQRIAKLSEEVDELKTEADKFREAMGREGGDVTMDALERVIKELKDVAAVVNQLDYLMLRRDWPDDVHEKLLRRDEDPEYDRDHPHEINVEAGETNGLN